MKEPHQCFCSDHHCSVSFFNFLCFQWDVILVVLPRQQMIKQEIITNVIINYQTILARSFCTRILVKVTLFQNQGQPSNRTYIIHTYQHVHHVHTHIYTYIHLYNMYFTYSTVLDAEVKVPDEPVGRCDQHQDATLVLAAALAASLPPQHTGVLNGHVTWIPKLKCAGRRRRRRRCHCHV